MVSLTGKARSNFIENLVWFKVVFSVAEDEKAGE